MDKTQIKQIIKQELPTIMREDAEIQQFILLMAHNHFADKRETESRFDRLLDELRQDREVQEKKWTQNQEAQEKKWTQNQEAQEKKWTQNQEAQEKKWEAQEKKWAQNQEAQEKKWAQNQEAQEKNQEAQEKKWAQNQEAQEKNQEAQEKKWAQNQEAQEKNQEAQEKKWEAQEKKWAQNQKNIEQLLNKYNSSIGALGARWGMHSEQSFRNALRSILNDSFDVEVLNITEFDDEGYVFGQPDQVELDIIIKNGLLIICEIKSSIGRSQMYTFGRKIAFYEKRHNRKANRTLVISPMVNDNAKRVAKKLGIEVHSYANEIESL